MRAYTAFLCLALASCENRPPPPTAATSPQPTPKPPTPSPQPEPNLAYPFRSQGRTIFASGSIPPLRWQAGLSPCRSNRCAVTLWLVDGDAVVDTKTAAWPASSADLRQEAVEQGWGAGDPLESAMDAKVWASGEEEQYVGTVTRAVKFGDVSGILVDQLRGFEHLRRHHELFIVRNRSLERVWQGEEGAGPAWSSTAIIDLTASAQAVVYYHGFRYPSAAEPDQLEITLLVWEGGALQQRTQHAHKQAVVAGSFPSIKAAHQARNNARECLGAFWVLPASLFSDLPGHFWLALPGTSSERLRQRLEAVRKCAYNQEARIVTMR